MSRKMRRKSRSGGSETWRVVLRIIRSAKPIRWWLALACLLAVVVILCALAGPTLLGDLIQVLYDCWAGAEVPGGLGASLVPGVPGPAGDLRRPEPVHLPEDAADEQRGQPPLHL